MTERILDGQSAVQELESPLSDGVPHLEYIRCRFVALMTT